MEGVYLLIILIIIVFLFVWAYRSKNKFAFDKSHRVCRCTPYHHKGIVHQGKYIKCPPGTKYEGQEYRCTEDSKWCVDIACNYLF